MEIALFILLIICVLVQSYYSLVYFHSIIKYQTPKQNAPSMPPVSVVVAARNEAKNLPRLLDSLILQDYPDFEIIIVNDRSTDDSAKILQTYQAKSSLVHCLEIKDLPTGWNGKKHALSRGIASAQNEIILLTDADCATRSNHWIHEMSSQFDSSIDFVLGFSPYLQRPGFLNHLIRYETLWTGIQYLSMAIKGKPYMGVGRNLAYKKEVFNNAGFEGLEHITGGDDDLLVNRLSDQNNTKICISTDAMVISIPNEHWRDYLSQKIRHLSVGKYYRKKDRTRLGLFALCNLFGWVLLFYLLFSGFNPIWILAIFGFRSTLFYIIFTRIGRKLGVRVIPLTLPLLDLFYNVFYLVVGLRALTAKRIKWS